MAPQSAIQPLVLRALYYRSFLNPPIMPHPIVAHVRADRCIFIQNYTPFRSFERSPKQCLDSGIFKCVSILLTPEIRSPEERVIFKSGLFQPFVFVKFSPLFLASRLWFSLLRRCTPPSVHAQAHFDVGVIFFSWVFS